MLGGAFTRSMQRQMRRPSWAARDARSRGGAEAEVLVGARSERRAVNAVVSATGRLRGGAASLGGGHTPRESARGNQLRAPASSRFARQLASRAVLVDTVRQVRASARPAQAVSSGLERMNERSSEPNATPVTSGPARRSRMNSGDGPGRSRTSARGFEGSVPTVRFAGRNKPMRSLRARVRAIPAVPGVRMIRADSRSRRGALLRLSTLTASGFAQLALAISRHARR
jgi:hypothetical protein